MLATIAASLALFGAAAAAAAPKGNAATPANWSYEIRNGQRVPKASRVVQGDGSWVEETKQGRCVVTRTGRDGEVREVRKCD
ncbi:MAG TPA: hypothetical protein VF582_07795 [Allosphingosinicella sp.]|jgi:hypothetical protein